MGYYTPLKLIRASSPSESRRTIEAANEHVPIGLLISLYSGDDIPADVSSWKTYCPLADEHPDGGIDKNFRVYPPTNTSHCFEMHGTLRPVDVELLCTTGPEGDRYAAASRLIELFDIRAALTLDERLELASRVADPYTDEHPLDLAWLTAAAHARLSRVHKNYDLLSITPPFVAALETCLHPMHRPYPTAAGIASWLDAVEATVEICLNNMA